MSLLLRITTLHLLSYWWRFPPQTNGATYSMAVLNEFDETEHYFTNNGYDSVTEIDAVPTEILNVAGQTDDATSITATAQLIEKYHPDVDATVCSSGVTYTVISARWSGSLEAGFSTLVQVPVEEDIVGGWEVQLTFSEPLTLFSMVR